MDLEDLSPRLLLGVGLLALLPTVWYAIGRPSSGGFVAAINVLVIVAALFVALQPVAESGSKTDHAAR